MSNKKTPAPRRAGSEQIVELRAALMRLADDPAALRLVSELVAQLASRSPISRR